MFNEIAGALSRGAALENLSGIVGGDTERTSGAVMGAVPLLLGAMGKRAQSAVGADALFDLIRGDDGEDLRDLEATVNGQSRYGDDADGLVSGLLGSRREAVEEGLAERTGLEVPSIGRLLPAIMPVVLGYLGRRQSNEGFGLDGLNQRLEDEGESMRGAGLGNLLGLLESDDDVGDDEGFIAAAGPWMGAAAVGAGAAGVAAGMADDGPLFQDAEGYEATSYDAGEYEYEDDYGDAGIGAVGSTPEVQAAPTLSRGYEAPNRPWWVLALAALLFLLVFGWLLSRCIGGDDGGDAGPDTSLAPGTVDPGASVSTPTEGYVSGQMLDVLQQSGQHAQFLAALESAGLAETLEGAGPFTLFAPTDAALATLPAEVSADPALLTEVLRHHVVNGDIPVVTDGSLTTLAGSELVTILSPEGPKAGEAIITISDSDPTNGTLHAVDRVILPATVLAQLGSINDQLSLDPITFESGSSVITADGEAVLDRAVTFLLANRVPVTVVGHTDASGDDADNQKLSEDRAQAVVNYLVDQGVDGSLLSAEGKGEAEPIADNETPEGRATNRRIEFLIQG